MNESSNKGLIYAVIFAAIIISGALVFMGLQMKNAAMDDATLSVKIEEGIEQYIQKQRDEQRRVQQERQKAVAEQVKNVRRVSTTRDHIFGNPDAVISLIEYSDFECPYCKRFHMTAKKVEKAYRGKVNWVYRHYPLDFHNPGAQKEAEASECVAELGGNKAFWSFIDKIYLRTKSGGKGFPVAKLTALAKEVGVNGQKFETCLNSGKYEARIKEDLAEGSSIGITGTPGSVILHNKTGETRFKAGAYPFEAFKADIDAMLH